MQDVKLLATCNGVGYWSRQEGRQVGIVGLNIGYLADDEKFGELKAYFDPLTWNVNEHGLIYTDEGWIRSFRKELRKLGFTASSKDVYYSEQGMQGSNYVSMDIGAKFIREWWRMGWV